MSASLVGSEMCIRDRSITAPSLAKFGLGPPSVAWTWAARRSGGSSASHFRDCLLYTSDAADDM
eukprot:14853657-Alexandrium_andersonii.AAC.1